MRRVVAKIESRGTALQSGDSKAGWVSHIPAHLHYTLNPKQRGREGGAGTAASRQQPDYSRSLCTSWDAGKTPSAERGGENGAQAESNGLTGLYWTMAGIVNSFQVLERNGGDDETRTRDLCRDRVATTSTYNNLQGYQGLPTT